MACKTCGGKGQVIVLTIMGRMRDDCPACGPLNTTPAPQSEVVGVQEAERSTGSYTSDNEHSNSVAEVGHSHAPGVEALREQSERQGDLIALFRAEY